MFSKNEKKTQTKKNRPLIKEKKFYGKNSRFSTSLRHSKPLQRPAARQIWRAFNRCNGIAKRDTLDLMLNPQQQPGALYNRFKGYDLKTDPLPTNLPQIWGKLPAAPSRTRFVGGTFQTRTLYAKFGVNPTSDFKTDPLPSQTSIE